MPYSSVSEVPDYVPSAKRKQWLAVFNSAFKRAKKKGKTDKQAEQSAFAQANAVAGPNAKTLLAIFQKLEDTSMGETSVGYVATASVAAESCRNCMYFDEGL